uniref:Uncharacterized protein n=1 Tax=Rhizophora mucronata TaxID=61149 RepID=A0A2P2NET6_RHIMU
MKFRFTMICLCKFLLMEQRGKTLLCFHHER